MIGLSTRTIGIDIPMYQIGREVIPLERGRILDEMGRIAPTRRGNRVMTTQGATGTRAKTINVHR